MLIAPASINKDLAERAPEMTSTSGPSGRTTEPGFPEVFQMGCIVSFESKLNERYQGEVIAFDDAHKAVILKCQNPDQKTTDVRLVNLGFITDMQIERGAGPDKPLPPAQVNVDKVRARMGKHREEREKMAAAIAGGVSTDGISLFLAIRKTIDEVTWQGQDILVMNSVRVQPPYKPENCVPSSDKLTSEHQSVSHVRNLVVKHLNDSRRAPPE